MNVLTVSNQWLRVVVVWC